MFGGCLEGGWGGVFWNMLGMFWERFGNELGMFWGCSGHQSSNIAGQVLWMYCPFDQRLGNAHVSHLLAQESDSCCLVFLPWRTSRGGFSCRRRSFFLATVALVCHGQKSQFVAVIC